MAKIGRLQGNFIEGMMCEGGCINGAGTLATPFKSKNTFNKVNSSASRKSVIDNEKINDYDKVNFERN